MQLIKICLTPITVESTAYSGSVKKTKAKLVNIRKSVREICRI